MSNNGKWKFALPCCALGLIAAAMGVAVAQQPDASPSAQASPDATSPQSTTEAQSDADQQVFLKACLARLDAVSPSFDPQTAKLIPEFRKIIARVVLHPETATQAEKNLAQNFFPKRGFFDDAAKADLTTNVQTQVQQIASSPISFVPNTVAVPGGQSKGVVLLKEAPDDPAPTTVVEIPDGTKNYPVDKRADLVAQRLTDAHTNDPLWLSNIEVDQINNEVVVGLPGSKDGYLITADKDFATLRGVSPETLAYDILDNLRSSADPTKKRDLRPDDSLDPAEKLTRASLYRENGDSAYAQHEDDRAEKMYLHAVALAPQYSIPYIRLGDLYIEERQNAKAMDILHQAEASAILTSDQKAQISKKLAQVASK